MINTKPTHQLVPILITGEVWKSLWFDCSCYVKLRCDNIWYSCYKKCRRKFRMKFPDMLVPNRKTINEDMKRLQTLWSILDIRKIRRRHVLGKLDETGPRLETPARTSTARDSGCGIATKWNKISARVVQKLYNAYRNAYRNETPPSEETFCRNWPQNLFYLATKLDLISVDK